MTDRFYWFSRFTKSFLRPFFGFFLVLFLSFSSLQGIATADPASPTTPPGETITTPTTPTTPAEKPAETPPETCSDAISGVGWIVCPGTGFFANAIDGIYSIISDFLNVKPITFASDSPLHTVWRYFRDLTNIIFVILLIVVIYSHLTGLGLSNYNIKRILPRIIVAAVMINLSFLLCTLAVDISNLLGAGLRGFFNSIAEITAKTSRFGGDAGLGWGQIAGLLLTGVGTGGLAVILAGGIKTVLLLFIPVVLGGLVAVLSGLLTIAARQAVIWLLVMTAPLAFVAYLLPNTEHWFKKWRTIFFQMLFFYPIFSLLFGASSLAGFAIVASADNAYSVILGMAVQVFPLFFSVSLMKMSGTVLDKINPFSRNLLSKATTPASDYARKRAQLSAERYYTKGAQATKYGYKGFKFRNLGAMANAKVKHLGRDLDDELAHAKKESTVTLAEYSNARATGKKIIAYKENGTPIYKTHYVESPDENGNLKLELKDVITGDEKMFLKYRDRILDKRLKESDLRVAKAMESFGDYINLEDATLSRKARAEVDLLTSANQKLNTDIYALESAIKNNEAADRRMLHKSVTEAYEKNPDGTIKHPEQYKKLIKEAAGYDAIRTATDISKIDPKDTFAVAMTEYENANIDKFRFDSINKVVSRSFAAAEADREANVKNYKIYSKNILSKDLNKLLDDFLATKNADGIVAAMEEMANRGDTNLIVKALAKYTNQDHYLEIGTDFTSTIASALMGLKSKDPTLGRFGKHINVETAMKTIKGDRKSSFITMEEFATGFDSEGEKTKGSLIDYMKGTNLSGIERTTFESLAILTAGKDNGGARKDLFDSILPQLISALPSYASGSEEINSAIYFMTGIKNKGGKLVQEIEANGPDAGEHNARIKKFLSSLTADNIINMKSDVLNAILEKFELDNPGKSAKMYVDSLDPRALSILANSPDISRIKGKNFALLKPTLDSLKKKES